MEITIDRSVLREVLRHVRAAIAGKYALPVLTGVRIVAGSGVVTFTATDLEMLAAYRLEEDGQRVTIGGCGAVVVPFADLVTVGKGKGTARIGTETRTVPGAGAGCGIGAEYVVLEGDGAASVPALEADDWPADGIDRFFRAGDGDTVAVAPFADVLEAASTDEARPILAGIYVNGGEIVATDSYRLHVAHRPDGETPRWALIPARAVRHAVTVAGKGKVDTFTVAGMGATAGTRPDAVTFTVAGPVGTATVAVRQIDGEFPNYRGLIPDLERENVQRVRLHVPDGDAVAAVLRTVSKAYRGTATPTRLEADGDTVVAVLRHDHRESRAVLPGVTLEGSPAATPAYNGEYLAGILAGTTGGRVVMDAANLKPAVLEDPTGTRRRLLMPVRV